MPTYEYECAKCKKTFELVQSMKDDALKTCPKKSLPPKNLGQGQGQTQDRRGGWLDLQGLRFLHHRLSQRRLQEIQKRFRQSHRNRLRDVNKIRLRQGRVAQTGIAQARSQASGQKRDVICHGESSSSPR